VYERNESREDSQLSPGSESSLKENGVKEIKARYAREKFGREKGGGKWLMERDETGGAW